MSGMFPDSGVPASEVHNSATNPSLAPGCTALYASSTRCTPRFDPESFNAIVSELVNLITCLGGTYDCSRLDNLCKLFQDKLTDNIAERTRIILATENFVVPDKITQIEAQVIGGGGAGGASGDGSGGGVTGNIGGGGGGGGYAYKLITGLVPGSTIVATVGLGGAPTIANGGNGGSSSFYGVTGTGGAGGASGTNTLSTAGIAGIGIGGDLNVSGSDGGFSGPNTGAVTLSDAIRIYGRGGPSSGGLSVPQFGPTGGTGRGFGTGGSGASGGVNVPGGAGAQGIIILRW